MSKTIVVQVCYESCYNTIHALVNNHLGNLEKVVTTRAGHLQEHALKVTMQWNNRVFRVV